MPGLMYTPTNSRSKSRNSKHRNADEVMTLDRNSGSPKKYQSASTTSGAPRSRSLLSGTPRSILEELSSQRLRRKSFVNPIRHAVMRVGC